MNTYHVTIKYTVETNYTIHAENEEAAEMRAWEKVQLNPDQAIDYGDWELLSIEKEGETA